MKRFRFIAVVLGIVLFSFFIIFVLQGEKSLLTHPEGVIAKGQLDAISWQYLLMLIVIVPTFIFLMVIFWKHSRKKKEQYDPERTFGWKGEVLLWVFPLCVVIGMIFITWESTHRLDPYKPIGDKKPLVIQVVALDWKWLFIYPEQGIATINYIQIPEKQPVHFLLAADGSPMNSFWIPQLSGQIYAMSGMITQLHILANKTGVYTGRAAEINGEGFADMLFTVKSTGVGEFEEWIDKVKESSNVLDENTYQALLKPSQNHPVVLYSSVEKDLFHKIVMKYMNP